MFFFPIKPQAHHPGVLLHHGLDLGVQGARHLPGPPEGLQLLPLADLRGGRRRHPAQRLLRLGQRAPPRKLRAILLHQERRDAGRGSKEAQALFPEEVTPVSSSELLQKVNFVSFF